MMLTREQFEAILPFASGTFNVDEYEEIADAREALREHDAAQRAWLALVEERLKVCSNWEDVERGRARILADELVSKVARIAELEQALRLHLAVAPDDPVLLTPLEQYVAQLEESLERAIKIINAAEITEADVQWAKEKLASVLSADHSRPESPRSV